MVSTITHPDRPESQRYLVEEDEEHAVAQNGPNGNVGKDTGNQASMVRHHDGSVRVDGHKGPCQRARHSRQVDEPRIVVVAEVERGEVDKVEDQDYLRPHSVPMDEEQHPDEVK